MRREPNVSHTGPERVIGHTGIGSPRIAAVNTYELTEAGPCEPLFRMEIDLPHGCIHARVRGSGIPVLIIHGGGLDHRHMLDALEPVFEDCAGWKRIYIDLPGHEMSRADDTITSQDDVLGMISAFVDVALEGERCAIIGESRGSYHAMGLVHTRPEDFLGAMLVVAGGMTDESRERLPKHRTLVSASRALPDNTSPELRDRFERLVVQNPDIPARIQRTKLPAYALADKELAARISRNFTYSFDLSKPIAVFQKPCLFINGRQDAMAGYWDTIDMFEFYPRATLAILDCAGHSLSWEQPELFKALMLEWLRRVEREI